MNDDHEQALASLQKIEQRRHGPPRFAAGTHPPGKQDTTARRGLGTDNFLYDKNAVPTEHQE
jgi:hypothetical protein